MADVAWIQARIAATREAIVATEAEIAAVKARAQSYTLDTGQTRQTVTRANLSELRNELKFQKEQLVEYENQLADASGSTGSTCHVTPAF